MHNRSAALALVGLLTLGTVLVTPHGKPQAGSSGAVRSVSTENLSGKMPPDFD